MLSYVCFMPVNGDFLAEVGDRFGTSADTILYNGAYICQEFNPQENQVWVKNANYWNADNVNIDRIERTYNAEALKLAPDMYKQGSVDQAKILRAAAGLAGRRLHRRPGAAHPRLLLHLLVAVQL